MFAKFDEIPSMILEVIKETKRYGHTFGRSDGRSFGRTDNVKTVYPPTNTVCGGYKYENEEMIERMYLKCNAIIFDTWYSYYLFHNLLNTV